MNDEKWNKVLIEWVNCLKLSKTISSTDELRDGEFLTNLQNVITKPRNGTGSTDVLTFVFDLLGQHYPNYLFENKNEIHLADLPGHDLKSITSLLMHYTCIYDRKDALTSPLCHSLSQTSQLIIRNFLQKITKDVTNSVMDDIIQSCTDDVSDHVTTRHQWLSVQCTTGKSSPLQDLFKTPVSKLGRLQEKDNIISKLRSDLELERYDKAELQDELKAHREKIKKFEQQLEQKNSEILKMRSEILALENRTPPHFQDVDSREMQRRLRAEIQTLEQYVKQIEEEQEEVKKEKDNFKEKLRYCQLQSNLWEEKCLEVERNFETLTEDASKQSKELRELQAHCSEITALLEEYRSKPNNDSSFYDTFTLMNGKSANETVPCEDLACSVVEVQLRDAQKLNEQLMGEIQNLKETNDLLCNDVNKLETKQTESEQSNSELTQKVTDLKIMNEKMLNRIKQLEDSVEKIELKKNELNLEVQKLNKLLNEAKILNEELTAKVERLEFSEKKLVDDLQVLQKESDKYKLMSEMLQYELADAILATDQVTVALRKSDEERSVLKQNLTNSENTRQILEVQFQEMKKTIKRLTKELEASIATNKQKDDHLQKIQIDLLSAESARDEFMTKFEEKLATSIDLEHENKKLKSQVESLRVQLEKYKKEIEEIQSSCTQKMEEAHIVEEKLSFDIMHLKKDKEQMFGQLNFAEEQIMELKQNKEKLLSELKRNEDSFKSLIKRNEELINDYQTSQNSLKIKNEELENLKAAENSLQLQLMDVLETNEINYKKIIELENSEKQHKKQLNDMHVLSQTVEKLQCEKDKVLKKLTDYEIKMDFLERDNSQVLSKLKESTETCTNLSLHNKKLTSEMGIFQEQIESLRGSLRRKDCEFENLKEQKETLEIGLTKDIEECKLNFLKLLKEKNAAESRVEEIAENFNHSEKEKLHLLSQYENLRLSNDKLNIVNKELTVKMANLQDDLVNVTTCLEKRDEEINKLKNNYLNLEEQLKETLTCLDESQGKYLKLEKIKICIDDELHEMHLMNEKIRSELQQVCCDKEQIINKLQNELDITKQDKMNLKIQLEEEKSHLVEEINDKDSLIIYQKQLHEELEKVKSEMKLCKERINKDSEIMAEHERKSKELYEALQLSENEIYKKQKQLDATVAELKECRNELSRVLCENDLIANEINHKLSEIKRIEQDKKSLLLKLEESEKKCYMINEDWTKEAETLRQQLLETSENHEKLKKEYQLLQEAKIEVEMQLQQNFIISDKLKYDMEVVQSDNSSYRDDLHRLKIKNLELARQMDNEKEEFNIMLKEARSIAENMRQEMQENQFQYEKEYSKWESEKSVQENLIEEMSRCMKSLEETVQDYEITISGLKNVVDSNMEKLEFLRDDATQKDKIEEEIRCVFAKLLENHNVDNQENNGGFRNFVVTNLEKLLCVKDEQLNEIKKKIFAILKEDENIVNETLEMCLKKIDSELNAKRQIVEKLNDMNLRLSELEVEKELLEVNNKEMKKKLKEEADERNRLCKEFEEKQFKTSVKIEKENVLGVSTKSNKSVEEELKKENMILKRKLVLADNAKNNLEKVLKELREEKKKKLAPPFSPSDDTLYKKLLQEYIQVKDEHLRFIKEKDDKIEFLINENNKLKANNISASEKLENQDKKLIQDLQNIREAYGNVMSINSKLELEVVTLKKLLDDRTTEVENFAHVKEAYERLLEENNKVMTEIDTLKYKRMRDKEEFVRLLKKEREDSTSKKIQEIRNEYESKLEKMKEKMLKLYREEVNKKMRSMKDGQNETANLIKTVATLKSELFEADQKIQLLEMEKEMQTRANRQFDNEILRTIRTQSVSSVTSLNQEKFNTLSKQQTLTREFTVSQKTSIGGLTAHQNLQMEDEEDLFNDKYLADLKEGRCTLPVDRESTATNRFSELAWRNSLVPPHLKSSYPAETQFVSPARFKDDDIKTGNVEFDDSLCKLLPGEKPRKKDFGTTSYKKPGPPTPSKNGGRLSLQGNEVHPMREHCETKTPKKATPSRIRALFTGRMSSTRDSSDSQSNVTPVRGRRLSIFKRPR